MEMLIIEKIPRVTKNRKKLEELLNVKITNRGKETRIEGEAEDEVIASQVLQALNYGIPYSEAITIKTEGKTFETVNIKEYTHQKNLERVRGRVIGTKGKALKTLSELTDSSMELKENTVAIVVAPENLQRTTEALIAIIKGAKHGAVYKELEHNFPKPIIDLGLKESPTKTMEDYEKKLKELENNE